MLRKDFGDYLTICIQDGEHFLLNSQINHFENVIVFLDCVCILETKMLFIHKFEPIPHAICMKQAFDSDAMVIFSMPRSLGFYYIERFRFVSYAITLI